MGLDLPHRGRQRPCRPALDHHAQFPAVSRHRDRASLAPRVRALPLARRLPTARRAGRRLQVGALDNARHLPSKHLGLRQVLPHAVAAGGHGLQAQRHDVVGPRVRAERAWGLRSLPLRVTPLAETVTPRHRVAPGQPHRGFIAAQQGRQGVPRLHATEGVPPVQHDRLEKGAQLSREPVSLHGLPPRQPANRVQKVDTLVHEGARVQAGDRLHGRLLPQPPREAAVVTLGTSPLESFHQMRRDVCCALPRWPPAAFPASWSGRPTSCQANALCRNLRPSRNIA